MLENERNQMDDYDPINATSDSADYSSSDYDDFLKDAERDDRIGTHDWLVSKVTHDFWPSGDPRIKIVGVLLTASGQNKPKADLTISPPPPASVIQAESRNWDGGKKKAIAQAITMYRKLAEYYQTSPEKIQEGDVFRVETAKTARKEDGTGGFVRVVAFHSKDKLGADGQAQQGVPF